MKMMFAFPLVVAGTGDLPLTMSWADWKATFGVAINGPEDEERQSIYEANVAFIEAENSKGHSYTLGVNAFSHLSEDEFLRQYTGATGGALAEDEANMGMLTEGARADAIDWTTQGIVNAVKDQAQCGSCWAFSAIGTVESAYALAGGELHSFSEQQLLDCEDYTQAGCDGGYNNKAMTYISKYGLCSEASYPYTAKDFNDDKCEAGSTEHGRPGEAKCTFELAAGVVSGYSSVAKNVAGLESALNQMPVSVTIKADSTFQSYRSGVLTENCPFLGQINHAVIAVGYDSESFKIRNSWGSSWGEQGYVRISKDSRNPFCLFKQAPVIPTMSATVDV